jgi:toxin ParE1/3/4
MKVIFTEEALANLDAILEYAEAHYPGLSTRLEERVKTVVARIAAWPESAQAITGKPGIRMAPLTRYPRF